jgi:CRISPR-associated exonuclease Cas4
MIDIDYIQISGLQHIVFCKRQWGLIHIEQEWVENQLTAEGQVLHDRVDEGYQEFRKGKRQYSGLHVKSHKYHIYGQTDLVEAFQDEARGQKVDSFGLKGSWLLFPVEFKRGKPKEHDADKIQLCAQALCLEEMTGTEIPEGSIFYGKVKKRLDISFDSALRKKTAEFIKIAHEILKEGKLPEPVFGKHCKMCSLFEICMPQKFSTRKLNAYKKELLG